MKTKGQKNRKRLLAVLLVCAILLTMQGFPALTETLNAADAIASPAAMGRTGNIIPVGDRSIVVQHIFQKGDSRKSI